jgi:Acyl-CoA reductase (LuxC)
MVLSERISVLAALSHALQPTDEGFQHAMARAQQENGWFTPDFVQIAADNICKAFLDIEKLTAFARAYEVPVENPNPKLVGIVMAGNIPLVGFHDLLCVFLAGHRAIVKPSSKDDVLIRFVVDRMTAANSEVASLITFAPLLKGCDAYIATGSNNSARYFDYYFAKYPSIIRRNRTSVAVLDGTETSDELNSLADDVHLFFGFGCRNVTQLYVPEGYDFVPLLEAMRRYSHFADHNKYKNNYDYQLAIALLNNQYYMTNGSVLMLEQPSHFSPISQLNYTFYADHETLMNTLQQDGDLQCIVGHARLPFGQSQQPQLADFADGVDTMRFLLTLQ